MVPVPDMHAIRVTSDGAQPILESVPKPQQQPGVAIVKILAASINPSDILNAQGSFHQAKLPRTLGRDYAGVIEAGPENLVGMEVYGTSGSSLSFDRDGTHAEYCAVPIDCIARKPSNLSFAQAAMVGVPFTTAALALKRAQTQPTDVVLVTGASGNVGSAICQLARLKGCKVLTAARHGRIDVDLSTDPRMKTAKDLTGGKGPDVVVDTTGSPAVLGAALSCLAPGGRLSYIAAPRKGSTEFTFNLQEVYREQKSVVGCNSVAEEQVQTATHLGDMTSAFESGELEAEKEENLRLISIKDAAETYTEVMSNDKKKRVIVF